MRGGEENIYSVDKFEFLFSEVSNLILYSYQEIVKNEQIEYTKIEDKYWVILGDRKEKPEEYIRNVFLDKKYMQNKNLKRKFEVNNLEFLPEVGELKERSLVGSHDIRVTGIAQKLFNEADEDIYFSIECKRLNNEGQSPQKYVTDGIKRYIVGKYSEKMPIAGMIGFIEDNILVYNDEINKTLEKNTTIPTEQYLTIKDNSTNTYKSIHQRNKNNTIQLYHFLLEFEGIIIKN